MANSSAGLLLAMATVALAQQAAPPPAQPAENKPASVEGVVRNTATGAPILRAHVMVDLVYPKQQQFGAMTNAEGKFSVTGLPVGNYSITVDKAGFVAPFDGGRRGAFVALKSGEARTVEMKLSPTGAILGRVTDPDGNPVEYAGVYADQGGTGYGVRSAPAVTDEKGNFRIGGLAPGRYRVRAAPQNLPFPPEIRSDGTAEPHFVPTYHPDAIEAKGATRVIVKSAMDVTGVDVKLRRTPFIRISGIVTGIPEGTSMQTARIELGQENGGTRSMNVVGPDGKFEYWNVEPGKWMVAAVVGARDQMMRSAGVEVEIRDQNVDNLELRLVPPFEVAGQVEFTDESVRPKATPGGAPLRFALQQANRTGGVTGTQPIVLSADGTFRFVGVQPGKYRFNYSWRATVKSIRLGNVEMPDNIIDLSFGAAGGPLTVVFGPATAEVSGVLRDEKGPVAGASVVLRNTAIGMGSTNSMFYATSGADGSYKFSSLPTGKFLLVAVDDGDTNPMNDNFEDYDDILENVTILGDEKIVKDLKRHPRR